MKTLIILILILFSVSIYAQKIEDLNCVGLSSIKVWSKMDNMKIKKTNFGNGGCRMMIMLTYHHPKYGTIFCCIDHAQICYKQLFIVDSNFSEFMLDEFKLSGCIKTFTQYAHFLIITFEKTNEFPGHVKLAETNIVPEGMD